MAIQAHLPKRVEWPCPVRSALKWTPVQDFKSFSKLFYYIISTTYQKIGDLFCPVHISYAYCVLTNSWPCTAHCAAYAVSNFVYPASFPPLYLLNVRLQFLIQSQITGRFIMRWFCFVFYYTTCLTPLPNIARHIKQARKGFRTIRARRYFGYIQTFSVIF